MVQISAPATASDLSDADAANAKTVSLPQPGSRSGSSQTPKTKSYSPTGPASQATPSAAPTAADAAESSEELFADAANMLSSDATHESDPAVANNAEIESPDAGVPVTTKFASYRLAALIGGGVLVGGLLLTLVARAILIDETPVAQVEESAVEPKAEQLPAVPDQGTLSELPPTETPADSKVEEPTENRSKNTNEPSAKPTATKPAEATPETVAMPEAPSPNSTEAPAKAADEPAETPLDETTPPENPFLFDIPEPTKPATKEPADEAPETTDEQRMKFANDPLTGVLGDAFPLFDEEMFEAPASQSISEAAAPAPSLPDPAETAPAEPVVEKPAPRNIEMNARLNDPFVNARFREIPLLDHLRNLTRWSTIPISVDPLALQSADLYGDKKINVNQSSTTTERLLRGAVEPLRMSLEIGANQIQVVPLKQAGDKPPTIRFQVEDLAANDKALGDLAYLVTHLVVPESWQGAGGTNQLRTGPKELRLSADSKTIFQALVLVEKLRIARGLSPRSRYAPELFSLTPRSEQAQAMLDKKVQLSFVEPTELLEIVEQLENSTGAVILINWDSLLKEGWNPDTRATMLAIDVPLREALGSLLKPLDMDYLAVNDRTLQIAMSGDVAQQKTVEFYPIQSLVDGPTQAAALIHRLKTELGIDEQSDQTILFDEPSKHLLARLTQPRQIELAAALAKLRTP
ncbi:MAG: hypothetical protein ACIALR_14660 [Blastopirellula sp. JB062]